MNVSIQKPHRLSGEIVSPGDKSVSHRAAMFNAIANGSAKVTNFSPGDDCKSTIGILENLGATFKRRAPENPKSGDTLIVQGNGINGLMEPDAVLDAGNSGTTMRLMSGILAGRPFKATMTGDESLRSRPMGRIIKPLSMMGALIEGREDNTLAPLIFKGGEMSGIEYALPVASAQLKSAVLLAGIRAEGVTKISQPELCRDHTERMLSAMGANIETHGLQVKVKQSQLHAMDVEVPGDISSAAFWIVAGIAHRNAELLVRNVGTNPTRAGVLTALAEMGADITLLDERTVAGEPVADVLAKTSQLRGTEIDGSIIPLLIDEIPVIAVAAAMAEGETVIRDAAELRVKETDRIAATVAWLKAAGVECEALEDGMAIQGRGAIGGGQFQSFGDHRIAMSLGIAALISETPITVLDAGSASISYPSFWNEIDALGGNVESN